MATISCSNFSLTKFNAEPILTAQRAIIQWKDKHTSAKYILYNAFDIILNHLKTTFNMKDKLPYNALQLIDLGVFNEIIDLLKYNTLDISLVKHGVHILYLMVVHSEDKMLSKKLLE